MTIYKPYEMDRFYHDYGFRIPANVPQFTQMLTQPCLQDRIQPMIARLFNAGSISVIYGRAGCGKTPLHFSLAHALAVGCDIDKIHKAAARPQSCLVVSGEMSAAQWDKMRKWNERIFPPPSAAFVQVANYDRKLDTEDGQRFFEDLVRRANAQHPRQSPVGVLIFDNIKTLTTGGDNATKWGMFFDFLNTLRQRHGWTIIVIHHTHKGKDDGSFGTYDIDIKVDNKIYIGRDFEKACDKVDGIERWLPPENNKDAFSEYSTFVRERTNEMLGGKYADSIWFYLALEKGRDFRPSEKLPVFMRMLPEDEKPQWEVVDILPDDSPWSYRSFQNAPREQKERMESDAATSGIPDAVESQEEKKPTYRELLKFRDRGLVLKWLRKAYAEGHETRQQMAEWLGCNRAALDNLMANDYYDHITEADLKE